MFVTGNAAICDRCVRSMAVPEAPKPPAPASSGESASDPEG
jgi:hypothetical protein